MHVASASRPLHTQSPRQRLAVQRATVPTLCTDVKGFTLKFTTGSKPYQNITCRGFYRANAKSESFTCSQEGQNTLMKPLPPERVQYVGISYRYMSALAFSRSSRAMDPAEPFAAQPTVRLVPESISVQITSAPPTRLVPRKCANWEENCRKRCRSSTPKLELRSWRNSESLMANAGRSRDFLFPLPMVLM